MYKVIGVRDCWQADFTNSCIEISNQASNRFMFFRWEDLIKCSQILALNLYELTIQLQAYLENGRKSKVNAAKCGLWITFLIIDSHLGRLWLRAFKKVEQEPFFVVLLIYLLGKVILLIPRFFPHMLGKHNASSNSSLWHSHLERKLNNTEEKATLSLS